MFADIGATQWNLFNFQKKGKRFPICFLLGISHETSATLQEWAVPYLYEGGTTVLTRYLSCICVLVEEEKEEFFLP